MLADIAIVTGGKVVTEELGIKLDNVGVDMLGSAAKVTGGVAVIKVGAAAAPTCIPATAARPPHLGPGPVAVYDAVQRPRAPCHGS